MKRIKHLLLWIMIVGVILPLAAQEVKEISVFSPAMNKKIACNVITPKAYNQDNSQRFPVVYLLHGYSGNHKSWLDITPKLPELASLYGIIIVCPDAQNSWYWDAPANPNAKYETFVAKELVKDIDLRYRTIRDRKARAITGLSMGGHGGIWLSSRHADTFGAGGSSSGGMDTRPFPDNWEMKIALGGYEKNRSIWDSHTAINSIDSLKNGDLAIIIDCGVDDFFIEVNRAIHKKLLDKKISHDYTERPGGHTGEYWRNAIEYQLLFFANFFTREDK